MEPTQIIFLITAIVMISSAVMVVSSQKLVHAALWLIVVLFGAAVLYALLEATFLAVVQVVVYIGAIAIMFIFAVMLTRRDLREHGEAWNKGWPAALAVVAVIAAALGSFLLKWDGLTKTAQPLDAGYDSVASLGTALTAPTGFVLPFEVASVLLLAAMLGSVYVAMNKK